MEEQFLSPVEAFVKKELMDLAEEIEKDKYSKSSTRFLDWVKETGLNLAVLSENKGGLGLNIRVISLILSEIAKASVSCAISLLSHLVSHILLEKLDLPIDNSLIYSTNLFSGDYLISSPFSDKSVVLLNSEDELVILDYSKIEEKFEKAEFLGLKGCSILKVNGQSITQEVEKTDIQKEKLLKVLSEVLNLLCAIAEGNAKNSYELAENYSRERYQGGDLIIKHKVIQEMLAKSEAKLFAVKASYLYSIELEDSRQKILSKYLGAQLCEEVCSDCLQVLGGYGYMKDFGLERRLRDAKVINALSSKRKLIKILYGD